MECTGIFRKRDELEGHLSAGAHRVMLSAPAKSDEIPTVVHGVNKLEGDSSIVSCASCTTNCVAPIVEVVGRRIGLRKAMMTTIHSYTSSQLIIDGFHRKARRGRAGANNFIPTSTGAAVATAKVLPDYEGKFDGVAVRGPVPAGSLVDIVLLTNQETSVKEVNSVIREESETDRYKGILGYTEDPIVSSDILRDTRASVVDLTMTQVVDSDLLKILSWYDNEWGYCCQMVRQAKAMLDEL
jgi:glyceraldehyde 3-phosphate dehydrogenase